MKVSDRIKELRTVMQDGILLSSVDRDILAARLIQLEANIAEDLQAARQKGFQAGRHVNDICGRG